VIFGMLGALSRYGLSVWMDMVDFPLATLAINLLGCFLLAFMTQYVARVTSLSYKFMSAVGTGLIGSFTMFSTFAHVSSLFIQMEDYIYIGKYIFSSLLFGVLMCIFVYLLSVILLIRRKGGRHYGYYAFSRNWSNVWCLGSCYQF